MSMFVTDNKIYTPTVRALVMQQYKATHPDDYSVSMSTALDAMLPNLWAFDFPIYEESHRKTLLKKIYMHYADYCIAYPYVEQWQDHMEQVMNEIMPYYNEVYKLEWQSLHGGIDGDEITFRTFEDYHIYTTDSRTNVGTNNSTTANIDYPDIGVGSVSLSDNDKNYVSNKNASTGNNTDNSNGTSETWRIGATGKDPFTMKKIAQDAINNVDAMVIEDKKLRELFYFNFNEMGCYV